ncbi:YraN family protein [Bacteroidia bacterium]|nr:YraN family protein [Bacteroidia bacterium]MDB9881920.1 YraN family protein [Bacteroidia bacterium]MDC1394889.1 YraN family protein [Bacteroidia bacterium]
MSTHKQQLGKEGEDIAAAHLSSKGYKILARNYRSERAEVDIVAMQDDLLIIVEVKTRETSQYGNPEEAVGTGKINMLAQATEDYMIDKDMNCNVRYDIISIIKNQYKTEVTHLEDAFWPGLY